MPKFIPDKTCAACGGPIPWRPGVPERARAKYCSEQCRIQHARNNYEKYCLTCNTRLPWREGKKEREQAKFCCNECKFAWQKKNPPRPRKGRAVTPCATCGKPVHYLPSQRRNGEGNIYCDRVCKGIGHSKLMTGRRPANGVYSSVHSFRATVRREFYDRCAICGWDEAPCDVAHIEARKNGGYDTLENVTMLCPNHHRLFDLGKISVETIRETRGRVLRHQ